MSTGKIQTGEQPTQLLDADGNNLVGCRGPFEAMFFKTFLPQTETIVVPVKDLNDRALPITKNKQVTGKGIKIHGLFDQDRKTVNGLSHIGTAHGQIDITGKPIGNQKVRSV
jgi:hypothetical protein